MIAIRDQSAYRLGPSSSASLSIQNPTIIISSWGLENQRMSTYLYMIMVSILFGVELSQGGQGTTVTQSNLLQQIAEMMATVDANLVKDFSNPQHKLS